MRWPAAQLRDHLAGSIGELLTGTIPPLVIPFRGRQDSEEGQSPTSPGPGYVAQPHQGNPAKATGLHHVASAGTHRITIYAQSTDLWARRRSRVPSMPKTRAPPPRSRFWNSRFSWTCDT